MKKHTYSQKRGRKQTGFHSNQMMIQPGKQSLWKTKQKMSSHTPLRIPTCTGSIQATFIKCLLQARRHAGTGAGQDLGPDFQGFTAYPGVDRHTLK